jgi:23S rRNA (adenine-N6)-dimethyltransferase
LGNIPFGVTTSILRRLLDVPSAPLLRADLIVQYEVARKRASVWPNDLLSVGWLPWWEFHLHRRLPVGAFDPPPAVDAGVLSITRRRPPLLPPERRSEYVALVRGGFRHADVPIERSLRGRLPERAWKRMARERGLSRRARVLDLDVFDWTALFRLVRDGGRV